MTSTYERIFLIAAMLAMQFTCLLPRGRASAGPAQETQAAAASSTAKAVGTVKTIAGNAVTLATDTGSTVTILMQDSTRLVRVAPGQKDLKGATPMQLQDVRVGDRVLIRGAATDDGKSIVGSLAIVMKEEDVAAKKEREREDWQKRGIGGLVSAVDARSATITLSSPDAGGSKTLIIHLSKETIIRRYAENSVKFDDATPGRLDQIKPGDQLRARGTRSPDGTEVAAEEVVSGSFRNIAGTVISVDAASNTVNVADLGTKKLVTLKISSDSLLRRLPPMVAQRIAARLKGQTPEGGPGATTAGPATSGADKTIAMRTGELHSSDNTGSARPNGRPDFQQMLNRMPAVTLADLQKGDAVMIVSTEGVASGQPTAITLLTGVEPILLASPTSGQAAMLLSPWNLSGGGVDATTGTTP
jgi:hypothetical protein